MFRTTIILTLLSLPVAAANFYVSPDGDDKFSGSLPSVNAAKSDGPFLTLQHARDQLRKIKPAGNTVFLRAGVYELPAGIQFGPEDSGATWRNYQGETPVLIGGRRISNFTPHQGQILKADLAAAGLKNPAFKQIIFAGARQHLARYPNYDENNPYGGGWAYADGKIVGIYQEVPGENKHTLVYKPTDARTWAHPEEVEVFVFPRYNWWNNVERIASIDPATHTATLAKDCSYAIRPADRYYFQNALEELDAPGEWYLDKRTSTLYFWPPVPPVSSPAGSKSAWELKPGGQWQQAGGATANTTAAQTTDHGPRTTDSAKATVSIPTTRTILQITSGTTDLTLRGLTFECSEGTAVTLQKTTRCTVAACTIRNVGDYNGSGVTVSDGSNNRVAGCDISFTGSHGIGLSGGDRPTLTPANNVADNNYIHHVGVFYKQGVGVSMNGVGNAATHNLIHDTPRMGIMFSGNNLLLEYNEIRHANLETEDTGAVYTGGRDWISSRGTVIRYNYFHDILGYGREGTKWLSPYFAWGVYLDDNTGGVDVIGNIVVRAHRAGLHLHNGRDNLIENNIFVDSSQQQFEYSGWTDASRMWKDHFPTMVKGYESVFNQPAWKNMRHMELAPKDAPLPDKTIMAGNVFQRNIVAYHDPKAKLFRGGNVNFAYNTFDNNVYFHAGLPLITGTLKKGETGDDFAAWQKAGRDTHSLVADPLFVDAAKDDYRLEPESVALKLGFKPIPVEKIGPYKDELRATWPIKQAEGAREKPLSQ